MVLNICYGRDTERLNYEHKCDNINTSEYEFGSYVANGGESDDEDCIHEVLLLLNGPGSNPENDQECQLIEEYLSHLNKIDTEAVKNIMEGHTEVSDNSFEDV